MSFSFKNFLKLIPFHSDLQGVKAMGAFATPLIIFERRLLRFDRFFLPRTNYHLCDDKGANIPLYTSHPMNRYIHFKPVDCFSYIIRCTNILVILVISLDVVSGSSHSLIRIFI